MTEKSSSPRKAKDQTGGPDSERGKLKDSLGAWKMSDKEEKRILSALKKDWRNATLAIRTTADLAGSGKKHASVSEMKHLLDRMRSEDD